MKNINEIISEALAKATAFELAEQAKAQHSADMGGGESLPHAIGCSTSGHEVRKPGKSELNQRASAVAPGHYAVFCSHNKPYWSPCTKCGRSAADAAKQVPIVIASLRRI